MKTKMTLFLALLSLTTLSFAQEAIYSGSNHGEKCEVRIDLENREFHNDRGGLWGRTETKSENQIVWQGGEDFMDMRVYLTFENGKLVSSKYQERTLLMPIFLTKEVCGNLVRVR